jgi:hypothetical protein
MHEGAAVGSLIGKVSDTLIFGEHGSIHKQNVTYTGSIQVVRTSHFRDMVGVMSYIRRGA